MLFTLGGIAATLAALELFLRFLPVSTSTATGYYIDPMILTYPAHHKFIVSTGWDLKNAQTHVTNNYGFVADHDFGSNENAVALIGDSFVEASMLASDERLAPQLESRLTGRPVYALGGPGSSLLDYAERIRFASSKFGVHDFVLLLEYGDVGQALCGSGNIHAQCLDANTLAPTIERRPAAGILKQVFRNVALTQYLFSQLKLDPALWTENLSTKLHIRNPESKPDEHRDPMNVAPNASQKVNDEFFDRVRPYPKTHLILILMGTHNTTGKKP
ncbi:MAG TPA: hypothetical protein VET48_07760, partial [Steroidobacteraceae bacterium]|nr:hypothetical protein [Steroidobacteraceae bacterium]